MLDCSVLFPRRFRTQVDKHTQTSGKPNEYTESDSVLLRTISYVVCASGPHLDYIVVR